MTNYNYTAKQFAGRYDVSRDQIIAAGAKWDDDYCCFKFPDGSTGVFTDATETGDASERTLSGENLLHFSAAPPESAA